VALAESVDSRPLASEHHRPTLDRAAGDRINAILQLLHSEHAGTISLTKVADVAHMAPAAVSRFFRRTTGATITSYLNIVRVNAACRLLVDTDLPITDIAGDCGYKNLSHFNRRFRLLKGMPPREYRARFRQQPLEDAGSRRA
jgi:AraC-like DNA-binding protein